MIPKTRLFTTLKRIIKQPCIRKFSKEECEDEESPLPKMLTLENMNPNIKVMEYAVRGPLAIRAAELEEELAAGKVKPFPSVIAANIGDCHAMNQCPITFIRQILAVVMYPELLKSEDIPIDVKKRASLFLSGCSGFSAGSYTPSPGNTVVRKTIAKYIEDRDCGICCNWQDIFITSGASEGIKSILKLFISNVDNKKPGILVGVPQYPLYSAAAVEFGIEPIYYYLVEENDWALEISELEKALEYAKVKNIMPRALSIINPGNPTGAVMPRCQIEEVIKFAYKERLFLLCDEVYQQNVFGDRCKFYSFKRVASEMGEPYASMEIASFMSISKGFMGECGLRGGFVELINIDPEVRKMYEKSISVCLCASTAGQAALIAITDPPRKDEPSNMLYCREKSSILRSLKERANLVVFKFNKMEGVSCRPVQGALYAFPLIKLSDSAKNAASKKKMSPDTFYAFELLEETGVCVLAGSGFGQTKGTYHIRTTILPQPDVLDDMMKRIEVFHEKFMKKYP